VVAAMRIVAGGPADPEFRARQVPARGRVQTRFAGNAGKMPALATALLCGERWCASETLERSLTHPDAGVCEDAAERPDTAPVRWKPP